MKLGDGSRKKTKRSRRATKADKGQRYPWEATEPLWTKVMLGALDLPAFMVNDASPITQAVHLFVDVQEIGMLRARVAQAGVPADLRGVPEEEIILAITEAVGAKPNMGDPTDLTASEAWVLVVFAQIDFWRRHAVESGAAEDASLYGMMLGRCIEWWRWRCRGHDRRAAGKGRSEAHLPKAREKRASNQEFDADWHEEAKQMARELHAKNPKRSRWDIAKELAQKLKISARYMSDIIKAAVP